VDATADAPGGTIDEDPGSPSSNSALAERHSNEIDQLAGRYLSFFFLITYLVLPGVTTTIAGTLPTVNVDPDGLMASGKYYYMRRDLDVKRESSRYAFGVAWAGVMFVIYPFGIPLLYYYVLHYNRHKIAMVDKGRSMSTVGAKRLMEYVTPQTITFLHGAYEAQFWYWEVVETARRLLLTAVVSVVSTGNRVLCF
jgi:hypothetical protein